MIKHCESKGSIDHNVTEGQYDKGEKDHINTENKIKKKHIRTFYKNWVIHEAICYPRDTESKLSCLFSCVSDYCHDIIYFMKHSRVVK